MAEHPSSSSGPPDPAPDPADDFGRRGELLHAVTCRLHHGPPLSEWDYLALVQLGKVLDLEFGRPA